MLLQRAPARIGSAMIAVLRLLATIAVRSMFAHRRMSLLVGSLLAFGAFLVVMATALGASIETAMRTSVVESLTGDIQVYDKDARDELQLFVSFGNASVDLGEIEDFAAVRDALLRLDNVKAVLPIGTANTTVSTQGELDRALETLRAAVSSGDAGVRDAAAARVQSLAARIAGERQLRAQLSDDPGELDEVAGASALARATSATLRSEIAAGGEGAVSIVDELDLRLAPLGEAGQVVYLRLVATDLDQAARQFTKLRVRAGEHVPTGHRGMLVSQRFLDRRLKAPVAMNLDTIHAELNKGKTLAGSALLRDLAESNARLTARIVYELSGSDAAIVERELRAALPGASAGDDLDGLLKRLLAVDDTTFAARYRTFYEVVGPRIRLYPFGVGDTITLKAITNSGYLKAVNVKVYGSYGFEGLESSDATSGFSLIDMMTFRDLYGQRTAALDEELRAMRKDVRADVVTRGDAEAMLFSSGPIVSEGSEAHSDGLDDGILASTGAREQASSPTFSQADVDHGMALSAAILLKDARLAKETLREVQRVGAPLGIQAVDWQRAAGLAGQFILVIRGVLLLGILAIFGVFLVIMNNVVVMAMLERVAEIGTMRAIGAGKHFVRWIIVCETGLLGAVAGSVGVVLATALLSWLHQVGIPARSDVMVFLYGGPRLFPNASAGNVLLGLLSTMIVSVLSSIHPAQLATSVQPVVAMQGKE